MSFTLSLSGHHGDADALEVEQIIESHVEAITKELEAYAITVTAQLSGSAVTRRWPAPVEAPPAAPESTPDADVPPPGVDGA